MLPNYDAKAVADALGVAFVRLPKNAGGSKVEGRSELIEIDGAFLLLVRRDARVRGARVSPPSPALIEKAVESGLPREALEHVAEAIAGGDEARASALERGIVPRTTLGRRESRLSRQESERTERVARLFVQARRALGSVAEARWFMTAPHPELDGRSPFQAARTDLGGRRAEQILNAVEYGLAV